MASETYPAASDWRLRQLNQPVAAQLAAPINMVKAISAVRDAADPGRRAELRADVAAIAQMLKPPPEADRLPDPRSVLALNLKLEPLGHLDIEETISRLHLGEKSSPSHSWSSAVPRLGFSLVG